MRGRGLKQCFVARENKIVWIAPHAGAWIETQQRSAGEDNMDIAPHAGAWIETPTEYLALGEEKYRPPCGGVD